MFHKTVTLYIFAVFLAVATCRPQVDVFDCSERENGPHADPLSNNAFYVCLDGEMVAHSKCDADETFDADIRFCTGGVEDEDLTTYAVGGESDDYAMDLKSEVSEVLNESLQDVEQPSPSARPRPRPTPVGNKIINIQVTDNFFPKSIILIGRANREQKNK